MSFSSFSKKITGKQEEISYAAVEGDPNPTDLDNTTPRPKIEGWPKAPARVRSFPFWIFVDAFLLFLPLGFIALASMARHLDGQPLSTYGRHVQEAILLGPTLFPLAYAALAGRSLKRIAMWKAERGTKLGTLEHLIGSQSLVSAIGRAVSLHHWGPLPFILLILWALSPLGGQSALRLMYETNSTVIQPRPLFYPNMDAMTDFVLESYNNAAIDRVNAVLSTSLMTADTLEFSPSDTWNHPKIPRIDQLESDDVNNSSNWDWFDIEEQVNRTYASLTGVNIMNLVEKTGANFTIPYQYLYYNCSMSPYTNASNSLGVMNYLTKLQNQTQLDGLYFILNNTAIAQIALMERAFFLLGTISNQTADKLLYGSQMFSMSLYLFECSMNSVAVEANIVCTSDTCETKRVRRLQSPKPKTGMGMTWDAAHRYYTFDRVLRHLQAVGGSDAWNAADLTRNPVDLFLYGGTPWGKDTTTGMPQNCNWTTYIIDPSKAVGLSQRMTKMMNTFWDASRWSVSVTRNDPYGKSSINVTSGQPYDVMAMNKTDATISSPVPIYKANKPWVAALVICSSVLFLLGLFSFLLSFSAPAPDIFDSVSSLTRDNPYVSIPQGGTALPGSERARLLKNLPVQLGDVNPMEEIGYIALKSVQGKGKQMLDQSRIRKERMYY